MLKTRYFQDNSFRLIAQYLFYDLVSHVPVVIIYQVQYSLFDTTLECKELRIIIYQVIEP